MKSFKKILTSTIATAFVLSTALFVGVHGVSADCYQYSEGMTTSTTPVFNNICGVPTTMNSTSGAYALGNEADFVRIRQNTGAYNQNAQNPKYTSDVTGTCNDGDKYDVWNYVHNDASATYNNLNADGTPVAAGKLGSAVATNVKLAINADTDKTQSSFNFGATVSADNAASVSDGATLNCGGKTVTLHLVKTSVHYSNDLTKNVYGDLTDGAVNGSTTLGNPNFGSGNQLGCWDYREVVVYQVVVEVTPPTPQVTATCDLFTIAATDNRKVKVSAFKYTNENASVKNVVLNWGDNTPVTTLTDANTVVGQSHQFGVDGTYNVTATVTFAVSGKADIVAGGAGTKCAQPVSFTSGKPSTPPTSTTPTPAPPTTLVNTGAGSVASIFAATTALGAAGYRYFLGRRLSRQ